MLNTQHMRSRVFKPHALFGVHAYVCALVALLVAVLVSGCSGQNSSNNTSQSGADASNQRSASYTIGVLQLVQHSALDSAYQGFLQGLKDRGYTEGNNLIIDYNNASGDPNNASTIAQKLSNNNPNLIFAIATQAAQAVAVQTKTIPTVVTAVTDPEQAGIVASNEAPGGNITGSSDRAPINEQIDLLTQLVPNAKRVGIIYNSSEDNSIIQLERAKQAIESRGLEVKELAVSKADEIISVLQAATGDIDALYAPTDNLVAQNVSAITSITTPRGIPFICGEEALLEGGALATRGIDYFELGKQAGDMAADILEGADPATMPIRYQETYAVKINHHVAEELGISIPAGLESEDDK